MTCHNGMSAYQNKKKKGIKKEKKKVDVQNE